MDKSRHELTLRMLAEEMAKRKSSGRPSVLSDVELEQLIHELEVDQKELELKNRELSLAKEQLEATTNKYTELYDFAPSGYMTFSRDGKIIEINRHGSMMLGRERFQLRFSRFHSFVQEDNKIIFNTFLDNIFTSGKRESCEVVITDRNLEKVLVQLTGIISSSKDHCLVNMSDITTYKKDEEVRKKLSQAVEQSPVLICITNPYGVFEYANPKTVEMTGYEMEDLIGKTPSLFKSGEITDDQYKQLWQTITSGKEWSGEFHNMRKNGELYWTRASVSPVFDNEGNISNYIAIQEDITDKKEAEDAIRKLNSQLEQRIEERTAKLRETNKQLQKEIKEHMLALEELQQALQKWEAIISASPDAIGMVSMDGRLEYISDKFPLMYGYTLEEKKELIGESIFQFTVPDQRMLMEQKLQESHTDQSDQQIMEILEVKKDGTRILVEVNYSILRNSRGNPTGVLFVQRDITERKQSENLLAQTRLNYETFFNTIDELLFVIDEDWKIVYTNRSVNQQLGYSNSETEGNNFLMIHPPELRDEAARLIKQVLHGKTETYNVPVLTKSGNFVHVETRLKQGFWNGRYVYFVVTKDVSRIKSSEEKFSTIFHLNPSLMAITHFENGTFIDVNNTFLRTLGYQRDDVIGKTFKELNLIADPGKTDEFVFDLRRNIIIRDVEGRIRTKSGEIIVALFSSDYIYIGNELCLLTVIVDITARKKAEEEAIRAGKEAEKANLAKNEFLSRMSHELRTPMNSILGFAQLMNMGDLNAQQQKSVGHILNSGKHLLNLINEMLDIARIEAGHINVDNKHIKIRDIVADMIEIIQPEAQKRKVSVALESSQADDLFVYADPQILRQVLLNLIVNAVKYNREGGSVCVKLGVVDNDSESGFNVRISVTDTGHGISEDDLQKLFIPFVRLGAEKTMTEGSGLGLAVVKRLMDAINGRVEVSSTPGSGSTFWIDLPLDAEIPERYA